MSFNRINCTHPDKCCNFEGMNTEHRTPYRIAILDLYDGHANEGMRCIRELVQQYSTIHQVEPRVEEFDVRGKLEVPDLGFDLYISSGGPGSPLESEGSEWENRYFNWLRSIEEYNANPGTVSKKYVLFICHSYQLACRYFQAGKVSRRRSTAFGIFPVHLLKSGHGEPVFEGLSNPFYAVDSRDYQVTQPNKKRLKAMGGEVLAIEKDRPHVPLERAVMAIRFNKYMLGTQFHPEADPTGMAMYFQREDKKQTVIENYGIEKWSSMIAQLNDPDKILNTYAHIIPNFLDQAFDNEASGKALLNAVE